MVPNGWNFKELTEVCSKPISYGIVQTGPEVNEGIPCVRVVDLTKQKLKTSDMILTSQEIHQSYKKTILQKNELMMALRGEIGLIRIVTDDLVGINITRGIARLAPKINDIDPNYLLWAMRSSHVKNDLMRKAGGSALQEIALTALRKVKVPVPPLPEQRKIATILGTWDKAISTTEQLIDNSKQQKKALMQQLLTGKKRLLDDSGKQFEGEWEEFQLGQLFKERVETGFNDLPLISITSTGGVISRDDVGRKDTSNKDKSKYRRICPNDIGYNTMRMWQGVSGLSDLEGIVSPAYTILIPQNGVSPKFASYLFKLPKLIHIFERNSQGLVSDTWNLKYPHFAKIRWHFPDYQEQEKIASVLINADKEIELLEQQLADLKQEKKALMQQLLTGKRRVKIDKKEVA